MVLRKATKKNTETKFRKACHDHEIEKEEKFHGLPFSLPACQAPFVTVGLWVYTILNQHLNEMHEWIWRYAKYL